MSRELLDRRRLLVLGATGAASIGVAGCAHSEPRQASGSAKPVLTAQATEGPYYFDAQKERADITEGHAGVPLDVRFVVCDETGAPLRNARVDIWHCNAAGLYSGYSGQGDDGQASTEGETFLRGYIATDAKGVALFRTIYPGWYRGRTTHIHFKVAAGGRTILTSQFFLPDALSEFLYTSLSDYHRTAVRDTLNSTDGIALEAGETVIGNVREEADRYVASLNIFVDRNATPVEERPPGGGSDAPFAGGRPPGPPPGGRPPGPPPGGAGGPPMGQTLTGEARLDALIPGEGV